MMVDNAKQAIAASKFLKSILNKSLELPLNSYVMAEVLSIDPICIPGSMNIPDIVLINKIAPRIVVCFAKDGQNGERPFPITLNMRQMINKVNPPATTLQIIGKKWNKEVGPTYLKP